MPIVERHVGESQMGFRKGKGTRDAIFQLRMISERVQKLNTEVEKKGMIITKARNYTYASLIIRKPLIE